MLSEIIFSVGLVLELSIVVRGIQARMLGEYPFFYVQSTCVLVATLVGWPVYVFFPDVYSQVPRFYWTIQFLTMITAACGILLEVLRQVVFQDSRARNFARGARLVLYAIAAGIGIAAFAALRGRQVEIVGIGLERDLRAVQAIFLFVILLAIFYYGISLGQNVKGIIIGYGLYVTGSLVSLALRAYGGISMDRLWVIVQPLSYDLSLVIWSVALWFYCPNPVPAPSIRLEEAYEALVLRRPEA